jgi:hypothetical protein
VSRFSWRAAAALILVSLIIGFQCPSGHAVRIFFFFSQQRCSLFFSPFYLLCSGRARVARISCRAAA